LVDQSPFNEYLRITLIVIAKRLKALAALEWQPVTTFEVPTDVKKKTDFSIFSEKDASALIAMFDPPTMDNWTPSVP